MTGRRRLAQLSTAVAVSLLCSQLVNMAPAAASVPGLVRISATSVNDNSDPKVATAHCPAGTVLLSAGYQMNGAMGEAVVDDLPLTNAASVTVTAYAEDPIPGNWNLTAYAICAQPLSGLVRLTDPSSGDSRGFKSAAIVCPPGKDLIGGGFILTGATGEALVDDILPNGSSGSEPRTVTDTAYETDIDYPGNWSLSTHAVCAHPLTGLVRRSTTSASNATDSRSVTANCLSGEVMVGAGYQMHGGLGNIVLDDFRPNGDATTAPTSITLSAYEADLNLTENWDITAHAVCASTAD
jgi:hypothetical protein